MHRTVVLNVAGLTPTLLRQAAPHLRALAEHGGWRPLETVLPAVTCAVQSTLTTGLFPSGHGCVANGWYFRDLAEISFWRQSNHLVAGEKIWETAARRNPSFTCAKLFWWFNMYSTADYTVTPRPIYPADGRKISDLYTQPPELREELTRQFGRFPLFNFWGPTAGIASSRWIAHCAQYVYDSRRPTLTFVYLPHLDYNLQRLGPDHPAIRDDVTAIDEVCGELTDHVQRQGDRIIVVSEYGVAPVNGAVHINRILRAAKWLRVRSELGQEKLDAGASEAFAVTDHQIAHVYVKSPALRKPVQDLLETQDGIDLVLDEDGKQAWHLNHPRSGELIALAKPDRWFSYYYWLDDGLAPDFARTVDIHRKPGYDPVELFLDHAIRWPRFTIGWKLLKHSLGFRSLMDVIPLDASLIKGSHGRVDTHPDVGPLIISSERSLLPDKALHATDVKGVILSHVFGKG